jgi:hypothetical protein
MTRPRSIPLKVVVANNRPPEQRPADNTPKLRFSDLLKARKSASQHAETGQVESKKVQALLADQNPEVEETWIEPIEESVKQEEETPADPLDTEWLESLLPTPESMEPTLMAARANAVGKASAITDIQSIPAVARAIAITVTRFCNERSVDESEGWQVRMPLNREVLPDTVMQLAISPYWLQLRFETSDEASRNLLFEHREALTELIGDALNRRRDIAISID